MKRAALVTAGGMSLLLGLVGCAAARPGVPAAPAAPGADQAVVFSTAATASAFRHAVPSAQEQAVTAPDNGTSGRVLVSAVRREVTLLARTMVRVDSLEPVVPDARPKTTVSRTKPLQPAASTAGTRPNALSTPAPPSGPRPPDLSQAAAYESAMLVQLNARRAEDGVPALRLSACADSYASAWSPLLARNGELSHRKLVPVLGRCHVRIVGENVGWNTSQSSADMVDAFMASPGHAANIMDRRYAVVGIGAFKDARGRWWVTQDFLG